MSQGPYYSKYQGLVIDNKDPEHRGRLKVRVPDVFGDQTLTTWALPALPYAGNKLGLFLIPPVNTNIWVEFAGGNIEVPVWTGCFWPEEQEVPAKNGSPDIKILKTESCTITLDDTPGSSSITIQMGDSVKIVIDSGGIEINNGQNAVIKLSGTQVSINNGALEVT